LTLKIRRAFGRMSLSGTKKLNLLRASKVVTAKFLSHLDKSEKNQILSDKSEKKNQIFLLLRQACSICTDGPSLAALISWLFPPAIILGMAFNVPGEYLYIGAAVFVVVFCVIEMDKPDKPHNFEPEIYMMERSARDKLIADYNTMDIWDFNEKYGELWDFTVDRRDEIVKSS
jgi:hypothetical protein